MKPSKEEQAARDEWEIETILEHHAETAARWIQEPSDKSTKELTVKDALSFVLNYPSHLRDVGLDYYEWHEQPGFLSLAIAKIDKRFEDSSRVLIDAGKAVDEELGQAIETGLKTLQGIYSSSWEGTEKGLAEDVWYPSFCNWPEALRGKEAEEKLSRLQIEDLTSLHAAMVKILNTPLSATPHVRVGCLKFKGDFSTVTFKKKEIPIEGQVQAIFRCLCEEPQAVNEATAKSRAEIETAVRDSMGDKCKAGKRWKVGDQFGGKDLESIFKDAIGQPKNKKKFGYWIKKNF